MNALQSVLVRMLYDPTFAAQVYAGAELPTLSPAEAAMARGVDPRALRTDPWRRGRALQAVMEELPAASALASKGGRDLPALDAFFSSPDFHASVQDRGSMALAYGVWLPRVSPSARSVAALELAVARASRRRRPPRGEGLTAAAGVWPMDLPAGTLARWQAIRARLGPDPVATLAERKISLKGLPKVQRSAREHLVIQPDPTGGLGVGGSSEAINLLLAALERPLPRPAALAQIRQLADVDADAAEAILSGLIEDGLIAPARPG